MQTKIQKWGNSLGLRIPKAFAEETGVGAGTEVDLSVRDGELVMRPSRRPRYRLDDLLKDISTRNLHSEEYSGPAVGREIW